MGIIERTMFRFHIGEVHVKHELHLFSFKLERKIKKLFRMLNFHYHILVK